jgi:hypothetical protein
MFAKYVTPESLYPVIWIVTNEKNPKIAPKPTVGWAFLKIPGFLNPEFHGLS